MAKNKTITDDMAVLTIDCYICGRMIAYGEGRYEMHEQRIANSTYKNMAARHDDCATASRERDL